MAARYHEIMKTKNFLPFTLDYLPPKMVQKAKDELKETDEIRGPAIEQLRKLVLTRWNPDEVTVTQGLCALSGLLLLAVDDPAGQICGIRVLVDVRGFTMKQVRCVTPRYITLLSKALRNCLPIRFKGIHIYNETVIFQYVWSVLKLFLSDKIRGRVHFHGDSQKNLHKYLPKEILSDDYGGDNTTFDGAEYCAQIMEPFFEKYLTITNGGYL
ncbi:unnamed protein product [Larinioides sclopetarius]|uniref:CRAL-TRIO domain-containing protein n=1 Tax=Larinioides sclopetarius TaxID=280406 RepID=A0AAV1ZQ92_9ARAC